jgi:hypothetical protein
VSLHQSIGSTRFSHGEKRKKKMEKRRRGSKKAQEKLLVRLQLRGRTGEARE